VGHFAGRFVDLFVDHFVDQFGGSKRGGEAEEVSCKVLFEDSDNYTKGKA